MINALIIFRLGLSGVYQGLTATVIKQGTNQMIRFFVYSNLKSWLQDGDPSKDIGSIKTFCIGGVAGAASVFGNTPVDVVKTRMQVTQLYFHVFISRLMKAQKLTAKVNPNLYFLHQ